MPLFRRCPIRKREWSSSCFHLPNQDSFCFGLGSGVKIFQLDRHHEYVQHTFKDSRFCHIDVEPLSFRCRTGQIRESRARSLIYVNISSSDTVSTPRLSAHSIDIAPAHADDVVRWIEIFNGRIIVRFRTFRFMPSIARSLWAGCEGLSLFRASSSDVYHLFGERVFPRVVMIDYLESTEIANITQHQFPALQHLKVRIRPTHSLRHAPMLKTLTRIVISVPTTAESREVHDFIASSLLGCPALIQVEVVFGMNRIADCNRRLSATLDHHQDLKLYMGCAPTCTDNYVGLMTRMRCVFSDQTLASRRQGNFSDQTLASRSQGSFSWQRESQVCRREIWVFRE